MQLSRDEIHEFFRLHKALMLFVGRRLGMIDETIATPEAYTNLSPKDRQKVHEAFVEHRELIDAFVAENPSRFDEADLEIVRSWKDLVAGTFYAFRQLQNHMVFLSAEEPIVAYGVLALTDSFEDILGPYLPRMIKTILLPFKGKIIYDGLASAYNITFGPGIRRRLNESYRRAKEWPGMITSLPPPAETPRPAAPKAVKKPRAKGAGKARGESAAAASAHAAHDRIVALTDAFCREYLDDEYGSLCRKMAGLLARKRSSPLTRGKPESWACGIVRVVGWVNFIGDPSQPDHMRLSDIDERFGVSEATGSAKSMAIRNLLKIRRLEPEWTLPSRMDQNPMAWLIQVNGLMMDARHLPKEIQEQAFRRGLIPYIPGDRADASDEE